MVSVSSSAPNCDEHHGDASLLATCVRSRNCRWSHDALEALSESTLNSGAPYDENQLAEHEISSDPVGKPRRRPACSRLRSRLLRTRGAPETAEGLRAVPGSKRLPRALQPAFRSTGARAASLVLSPGPFNSSSRFRISAPDAKRAAQCSQSGRWIFRIDSR
jgi:hypothetical protein